MTTIEEIAYFVSHYHPALNENKTIEVIRSHVLDTIGGMIAGSYTAEGRANALLFGKSDIGYSLLTKIIIRCANTRLTETDDVHLASCTTPGSVVIPTVLTLVKQLKPDDKEVLESIIVGYELMTLLGASIDGPVILYKGFWPTLLCASFASAGAASKLLRLDALETAHALAIALAPIIGRVPRSKDGLSPRWLTLGLAAQKGVIAALAAKRSFKGDTSILDEGGYSRSFGIRFDRDRFEGISTSLKRRELAIMQTSLKPYCIAKQAVSSAECFSHVLEKGVEPDKIVSVDVWVPRHYKEMLDHLPSPKERLSSISSLPYRLALLAYDRKKLFDPDHRTLVDSKKIQHLMNKIRVHRGKSLDRFYPNSWPARVEVKTNSESHSVRITVAHGDPGRPFTKLHIQSKFKGIVGRIISDKFSDEIIQLVNKIPSRNTFARLEGVVSSLETDIQA